MKAFYYDTTSVLNRYLREGGNLPTQFPVHIKQGASEMDIFYAVCNCMGAFLKKGFAVNAHPSKIPDLIEKASIIIPFNEIPSTNTTKNNNFDKLYFLLYRVEDTDIYNCIITELKEDIPHEKILLCRT